MAVHAAERAQTARQVAVDDRFCGEEERLARILRPKVRESRSDAAIGKQADEAAAVHACGRQVQVRQSRDEAVRVTSFLLF